MLNHKHIVKLFHSFIIDKNYVMIMEYASGGELLEYAENKGIMPEIEVRKII